MKHAINSNQEYLMKQYPELIERLKQGQSYASVKEISAYIGIGKDTLRAKCLCRTEDISFPYMIGGNNRIKIPIIPFLKWMTSISDEDITSLILE